MTLGNGTIVGMISMLLHADELIFFFFVYLVYLGVVLLLARPTKKTGEITTKFGCENDGLYTTVDSPPTVVQPGSYTL